MEQLKCFLWNVLASQGSFLPPLGSRFPALATWLRQVSLWEHASEVLTPSVALWNCAVYACCCDWIFQLPDSKWAASSVPFLREKSSWALGPFVLGCFTSFCVQNIDKRDIFKINKLSGSSVENWPFCITLITVAEFTVSLSTTYWGWSWTRCLSQQQAKSTCCHSNGSGDVVTCY